MIGNIIAYTIVAIFGCLGAYGFGSSINQVCKGEPKEAAEVFWPSMALLAIGLFFAWMWGI